MMLPIIPQHITVTAGSVMVKDKINSNHMIGGGHEHCANSTYKMCVILIAHTMYKPMCTGQFINQTDAKT